MTAALDHAFRNPDLLRQALTHRSYGVPHNERLEFVGDAVLNCVVALVLFERFPALPEGDLSRVRASLVNQDTLARVARRVALGPRIRLGEGELRGNGADRPSILADALEAVFGAVFLDAGFDAARATIAACYAEVLAEADPAALGKDPKTRLQEWLQARRLPLPEYARARHDGRGARAVVHRRVPRARAGPAQRAAKARAGASPNRTPRRPCSRWPPPHAAVRSDAGA